MSTDWVSIKPIGPFNLAKTIECGQMFRWQRRRHSDIGEHYEIVIFGNVVHIGQVDREIMFSSAPVPPKNFRPRLEHYLALDHDLEQTYAALASDPCGVMSCLTDRHSGLRILRQEPWECMASFICTAQTKIEKTRQLVEGMACQFGDRIDGSAHRVFPPPSVLTQVGVDPLEQLFKKLKARFPTKFASNSEIEELPRTRPWTEGNLRRWGRERFGPNAGYASQYLFYANRRLEDPRLP